MDYYSNFYFVISPELQVSSVTVKPGPRNSEGPLCLTSDVPAPSSPGLNARVTPGLLSVARMDWLWNFVPSESQPLLRNQTQLPVCGIIPKEGGAPVGSTFLLCCSVARACVMAEAIKAISHGSGDCWEAATRNYSCLR